MVFTELDPTNAGRKVKRREELEDEFRAQVQPNEGEAASHGIYFDDTKYDYMQHMRDLGSFGNAHYIEAPAASAEAGNEVIAKGKGKGKVGLEEALRAVNLDESRSMASSSVASSKARELIDADMLPSEFVQKKSYQDQQNVPDAIAGFQPDMDPRLREVLEALDDEAYVDDEEDLFEELAQDEVVTEGGLWEEQYEDEGWETDDTIKAKSSKGLATLPVTEPESGDSQEDMDIQQNTNDWMAEYKKFKQDTQKSIAKKPIVQKSEVESVAYTGLSSMPSKKRKKRKGALTTSSGYSMSSSVLARTEVESLLDARFDKIEEEYAADDCDSMGGLEDDDGRLSQVSGSVSGSISSKAPLMSSAFDSVMDDFLDNHRMVGRSRVRKGPPQTGMEQLDEIRKGLGPAVVRT